MSNYPRHDASSTMTKAWRRDQRDEHATRSLRGAINTYLGYGYTGNERIHTDLENIVRRLREREAAIVRRWD